MPLIVSPWLNLGFPSRESRSREFPGKNGNGNPVPGLLIFIRETGKNGKFFRSTESSTFSMSDVQNATGASNRSTIIDNRNLRISMCEFTLIIVNYDFA